MYVKCLKACLARVSAIRLKNHYGGMRYITVMVVVMVMVVNPIVGECINPVED